jgi:hypothetical protein
MANVAKTQQFNPLFLTIPSLLVDINSKTGGMGEAGVVATGKSYFTAPYQNPSLLVKSDKSAGAFISCIPNISDIYKSEFAMNMMLFYKWNDKNILGSEFTYYDMGQIFNYPFQPYDYYINLNYAHRFNNNLSVGTVVKYIHNDLCGDSNCGEEYHPGRTFAVDLGTDYENELDLAEDLSVSYDFGAAIENLGPRVSYTDGVNKHYLPASLAIGTMLSFFDKTDEKTKFVFTIAYQAEKLLVPTPPTYYIDSLDASGDKVIREGRKPPSSLPLSWIQSFYDAPGGFEEEWYETIHKFGVELNIEFSENFKSALRYGRHYEHETKSDKRYNTFGIGFYIYGITLDARLNKGNWTSLDNTYGFTAGLQLNL